MIKSENPGLLLESPKFGSIFTTNENTIGKATELLDTTDGFPFERPCDNMLYIGSSRVENLCGNLKEFSSKLTCSLGTKLYYFIAAIFMLQDVPIIYRYLNRNDIPTGVGVKTLNSESDDISSLFLASCGNISVLQFSHMKRSVNEIRRCQMSLTF